MSLTTNARKQVEEVPYGMYVWEFPDKSVAGDGEGNIMNVFCVKGDKRAIEAMKAAVKHYGFDDLGGQLVWWSGKRPISDEQYAEQQARASAGLVPDPLDYGAIKDEERALRNGRR